MPHRVVVLASRSGKHLERALRFARLLHSDRLETWHVREPDDRRLRVHWQERHADIPLTLLDAGPDGVAATLRRHVRRVKEQDPGTLHHRGGRRTGGGPPLAARPGPPPGRRPLHPLGAAPGVRGGGRRRATTGPPAIRTDPGRAATRCSPWSPSGWCAWPAPAWTSAGAWAARCAGWRRSCWSPRSPPPPCGQCSTPAPSAPGRCGPCTWRSNQNSGPGSKPPGPSTR